jgi:hypothetical protein
MRIPYVHVQRPVSDARTNSREGAGMYETRVQEHELGGVPARDRRLTECLTGIELCRKRTDGNGSVTQRPWQRLLCAWGYSELCVSWPETS